MKQYKTADLCDQFSDQLQICEPVFRDFGGVQNFRGAVATVRCFEDNTKVREMLSGPGKGRILVVDAGGSLRCAMLGDLLAKKAVDNGWVGVVMNGCIRDSIEIAGMRLGVKALGAHPLKSVKQGHGESEVPVRFAGVLFRPGDYLYADPDGVVLSHEPLG